MRRYNTDKCRQIGLCSMLSLAPLPAAAATVYPTPGTYAGTETIEAVAGCCFPGKVGDTNTIAFQYKGPNAAKYKLWETASSNPPVIGKDVLSVTNGLGTSSPSGTIEYTSFSPPYGISHVTDIYWSAKFGYFDAESFTMVLSEGFGSFSVVYDIALTRRGGLPASD